MGYTFQALGVVETQKIGPFPTSEEAARAACPTGTVSGGTGGGSLVKGYYKYCSPQPPQIVAVQSLNVPSEPRTAADCPKGAFFQAEAVRGTRTSPVRIPARCVQCKTVVPSYPCSEVLNTTPGTGSGPIVVGTKTCYPQPILTMLRVPGSTGGGILAQSRQIPADQACPGGYTPVAPATPCPSGTGRLKSGGACEPIPCFPGTTRGADGTCRTVLVDGRCPSGTYDNRDSCKMPDGRFVSIQTTPMCVPNMISSQAKPQPRACSAEIVAREGGSAPLVDDFAPPTTETDCQTGYVLRPAQGTDPAKCVPVSQPTPPLVVVPPGPQPPAEVKASSVDADWLKANWKWLAALAAVGGGTYWWAKSRKNA